ncbi:MAG: UvrD-helicase domain-containing protein [Bdellovibrionota bacterium]
MTTESNVERVLVEAGAGCGKTTSIISKFLDSLKPKKAGGKAYLPEQCLLLTFTDAAAREMRVRIKDKDPTLALENTYVGTFHAYCLRLLSSARLIDSQAKILSDEELTLIIKDEFIAKLSVHPQLQELLSFINIKEVLSLILWGSDSNKEINGELNNTFSEIEKTWRDFSKKLTLSLNSLDLEDLDPSDWPQQALNLLDKDLSASIRFSQKKALKEISKNHPTVLQNVKQLRSLQSKEIFTPLLDLFEKEKSIFGFLAQSLNDLRATIPTHITFTEIERRCLKGLRDGIIKAPKLSLIIVDEFQDTSPEQWEIIERLSSNESEWYLVGDPKQSIYAFRKADIRLYKKLKSQITVKELATNYRSAKSVLNACNKLQATTFSDPLDPSPQNLHAGKDYEEIKNPVTVTEFAEWNLAILKDRILKRNEETPHKKHAVLFREWKKLYAFAEYLVSLKIPFQVQGSENHLDHFLTPAFLEALRLKGEEGFVDYLAFFYEYCHKLEPERWPPGPQWTACMERLLIDLRSKDISDWRKIAGLLSSGKYPNIHIQSPLAAESQSTLHLTLMTIHGSKGIEFDFDYLPDPRERASHKESFDEDEIPFKFLVSAQVKSRSLLHELQKIDRNFKLESEQKRLFYVAITRAKLGMDFFIPLETTKTARSEDPPWWGIWRTENSLKRFRWSSAIRQLDSTDAHFIKIEESSEAKVNDTLVEPKPLQNNKAPLSSVQDAKTQESAQKSEEQLWGEGLHAILEIWNGDLENLDQIIPQQHFNEYKEILLALRSCPELSLYWEVLSSKKSEWMLLREEALIEQSDEVESFRYADVLMLKEDEALIIDWKSSLRESLLSSEDRKNKIKAQLNIYAKAISTQIPKVKTLAIGIFREERTVKALKL